MTFSAYYTFIIASHEAAASERELHRSYRPTVRQRLRALVAGLRRSEAARSDPNPDAQSRIPR